MASKPIRTRREFLEKTFNTGIWATVAASGLLGPLIKVMAAVPIELPPGQSIYDFDGDVTVDGQAITDDNMLKTVIRVDSTVVTGEDSWIIFVVGKDAHHLRGNSRLELESTGIFSEAMRLLTGSVLSVFAQRKETDKDYEMHTSTATVGIRGTGVYAESEPAMKRSYVCTCYGDVNISAIANPSVNEDITTTHHESPRYIYADDSKGDMIQAGPFKNHTDEELQLIETIVGRNTPYSSVKKAYPRPRKGY